MHVHTYRTMTNCKLLEKLPKNSNQGLNMKNVKNKGNFKTDTNDLILHDVKSPTSRGAYFKYLSSKSVAKTRNFNLISY